MTTQIIKLIKAHSVKLVKGLKNGEAIAIYGTDRKNIRAILFGTLYITEYKKKSHPSRIDSETYSYKPKKLTRINFSPSKELKAML